MVPTFDELVRRLDDDDPSARAAAARALGSLHVRDAVDPLWEAFRRDPEIE